MTRERFLAVSVVALAIFMVAVNLNAAEKMKVGTGVKLSSAYYLPMLAADQGGTWKQNGLDGEWVPFRGSSDMLRAVAGGTLNVAITTAASGMQSASRGVPLIIVSNLYPRDEFFFWVRPESRFKEPKDLKGAKIGTARFGGTVHAYDLAVAKSLGLEKDIRIVSTGGISEGLAMMKTGVVDVENQPLDIMIELKLKGEVREFLKVHDYLPKEWVDHVVLAQTDFSKKEPETVKRVVKAILQGVDYIRKEPAWAMAKMREMSGFSVEASRIIYERHLGLFTRDGKIETKALENVKNFLIEYNIVAKDKALPVDKLYTAEFLP